MIYVGVDHAPCITPLYPSILGNFLGWKFSYKLSSYKIRILNIRTAQDSYTLNDCIEGRGPSS